MLQVMNFTGVYEIFTGVYETLQVSMRNRHLFLDRSICYNYDLNYCRCCLPSIKGAVANAICAWTIRTVCFLLVFQNLIYRETIVVFVFCFSDITSYAKNKNNNKIDTLLCALRRIADLAFNYSAYLITLRMPTI